MFAGMLTSCSDATDIIQKDEAGEDIVYQTVDDLQRGLNGVYSQYSPDSNANGNGDVILFNDLFTDNLKAGINNSGHGIGMYQFNLQPGSDAPERIWGNRYSTINFANRVLRAAERIEESVDESEMSKFNHIKAQLLGIRALAHFDIFLYFTPDYLDTSSLSAIIMDYVPEILDKPTRNTSGEVAAFIKSDLEQAASLIDNSASDVFFVNKDVIKALQAKLALVTGDYPTAGTLAGELLASYPLANRTQYIALFEDLGTTELIFGLRRVVDDINIAGSWYANFSAIDGSVLFEMSRQLFELYEPGDVRIDEVLLDATSDVANNILLIDKYPGSEQPLRNDVKVIRSSEMAFIVAEAQARAGQFAASAATVQMVTDARYNGAGTSPAVSYGDLNSALNRILLERRKEFCFEGHRYLDIKRLGKEIGQGINRLTSDAASFSAPATLGASDYRFTLPIPQAELNGNRNAEQNPQYAN